MARKKSATKKAREAQEKLAQEQGVVESKPVDEKADQKEKPLAEDDDEEQEESSDSEIEDEYGELLTTNVEEQIQNVLTAIKQDPKKLLDPNTKFFDENQVEITKKSGDKPLYLKDYHRMNLLSGDYKKDDEYDNEYGTVDGGKPLVVMEREERKKLLEDIDNAFSDNEGGSEGDDDEDFLKKKAKQEVKEVQDPMSLVDPNANAEEFLSSYLKNEAWIPKKNDKVIDLDQMDNEDEQEFDDAVEDFERAYNFRYEDPHAAEIVSYARNQATLRRGKTNARKRARERSHAVKEQEKHEIEQELQKRKTQKINKVMDRLAKIKEAVGDDIPDEKIERVFGDSLLNEEFDDADWDSKMAEIFNEEYYEEEMVKPEWGEDDELMTEFYEEQNANKDAENDDEAAENVENKETEDAGNDKEESEEPADKTTKKKKALKEKKSAKKEKKSLKEKAQSLVEANALKIRDEIEEERGRAKGKDDEVQFKYREVSPESYGLSAREIFLADDSQLNKYFSIKKFAPYKPKEQALKDKRRYTKSKRLKQWRQDVFRDKNGPARHENEAENEIWIPMEDEGPVRKKAKKANKSKKSSK